MVDSSKDALIKQINTIATALDTNSTPASKTHAVIANFKEIQKAILEEINIP